jgi:hypothetical protein
LSDVRKALAFGACDDGGGEVSAFDFREIWQNLNVELTDSEAKVGLT